LGTGEYGPYVELHEGLHGGLRSLCFWRLEEEDQGGVARRVNVAELVDSREGLQVVDVRW
jgi:hypothetical protein